jgi:hypothetical protein
MHMSQRSISLDSYKGEEEVRTAQMYLPAAGPDSTGRVDASGIVGPSHGLEARTFDACHDAVRAKTATPRVYTEKMELVRHL